MYWPNLKSVTFPVPEIIEGTRRTLTAQNVIKIEKAFVNVAHKNIIRA